MIIDQLTAIPSPQGTDELPIERGTLTYKITYDDLVGDAINELETDIGDVSTLSGFTATDLTGAANELNAKTDTFVRPNLLDNWYFVGGGSQQGGEQFPINQRGQTSYSGEVRGIDRFVGETGSSVTVHSGYVTFTGTVIQFISLAQLKNLAGKTVTISALQYYNGQVYLKSKTGVVNEYTTDTDIKANLEGWGNVSFKIFPNSQSYQGCRIYGNTNGVNLIAVKLEIGDTQTLAHQENGAWVLNELPNYAEQLYRCCASTIDKDDTYANNPYGVPITEIIPFDDTLASNNASTIMRNGNMRLLTFSAEVITAGTWQTFATLDPKDRPKIDTVGILGGYGISNGEVYVNSDGRIRGNIASAGYNKGIVLWYV